ncbi:hypothetical protein PIB30_029729 [Stylosanthes scabra]|uniref:Protein kinase domain-containing protein n=1 Tax=Stylosanthes scabra TaxID=79078 RepID=A0ABU6Y9W1_9FABA|nr:hypothetical protein [Stylosanthes scabra]
MATSSNNEGSKSGVSMNISRRNSSSSERKKKGGEGDEDGLGFKRKLRFWFGCMALRSKPKDSYETHKYKEHGVEEKIAITSSITSNNNSPITDHGAGETTTITTTTTNATRIVSEEERAYPNLRSFRYKDLKLATRNFKREHFLGEGGFGSVYKGWLSRDDHMTPSRPAFGFPVAIKSLNQFGLQGHEEWLAEVNYLSQLEHPNLVKLIGFCNEGDYRLLVYEFMPRGSLESHLFRRAVVFPWCTRMRIMLDAAKGLAYLHEKTENKNAVIFRDFKSSNILLDRDLNAKLSDFGFAKDGPEGDRTHISTRVMGTQGYAAPEYVMRGHLSAKSDVYSFGVVMLEMVTGRKVIDRLRPYNEMNLVNWALPLIMDNARNCHNVLVDPRLHGQYSKKASVKALKLASHCLRFNPSLRPSMASVVQTISNFPQEASPLPIPPPPSLATTTAATINNSNHNKYGLVLPSSSDASGSGSTSRNSNVPSRFRASPYHPNNQQHHHHQHQPHVADVASTSSSTPRRNSRIDQRR